MVHIETYRINFPPVVVAVNVDGSGTVRIAAGFTARGAAKRLLRMMEKEYANAGF